MSLSEKIKRCWCVLWKKPGRWWLFGIPLGGFAAFIVGILFWGGLHWGIEATNTLEFCISCHEMKTTVYEEYLERPHYKNQIGVRAICTDCHVPKTWWPKMVRKVKSSRELYHKVMGTVDTPEKFEAKRLELAEKVWAEMRENNSLECRNCHHFDAMSLKLQDRIAQRKHTPEWHEEHGDTCIDCHQGIAHKLPEIK